MSREIEDGMGFSGLVPTAAERRAEAAEMAVIERLNRAHMVTVNRLAAERDEALRMENQAHVRVAELEAFIAKVLPPGIEDGCDECGGDLAKCHAEDPECYIAEARRLLPASVPETKHD